MKGQASLDALVVKRTVSALEDDLLLLLEKMVATNSYSHNAAGIIRVAELIRQALPPPLVLGSAKATNECSLWICSYGPADSDPSSDSSWTWVDASYNQAYGNDDEYMATLSADTAGSYDYAYRFSYDSPDYVYWTYCDLDWNSPTDPWDHTQAGQLTVTE